MIGFDEIIDDEADDEGEIADILEPEPKRHKPEWEPYDLETRLHEREVLGEAPRERETCFGCIYLGEKDKTAIEFEKVYDLIKIIRESVARCDPITLAVYVGRKYRKYQREINHNLLNGEKPLPDWPPAMILDHIRYHNTDPELQTWLRLDEIQQLQKVALSAIVEIDKETGKQRTNPQQVRAYNDLVKLYYHVAKIDANKCMFKSNESYMDMKAACQPPIALTGKTLLDYFKPRKR